MESPTFSHPPEAGVAAEFTGDAIRHVPHKDLDFLEELGHRSFIDAR